MLFVVPGLLVTVGVYLQLKAKRAGLIILLIIGLYLAAMGVVHLLGGVVYLFGFWGGLLILMQSVLAVLTTILSLVSLKWRHAKTT